MPWFRLTLTSPLHPAEPPTEASVAPRFASPWAYSVASLGEPSLLRSSALNVHYAAASDTRSAVRNMPTGNPAGSSTAELFGIPSENFAVVNGPLIITVWGLRTVNITLPGLHNYSRTLSIADIPLDPILSTALMITSFRDAVIDLQTATSVVYGLAVASLYPAIVAQLVLFFHIVIRSTMWSCSRCESNNPLRISLLHPTTELLPSTAALLTAGVLCIISAVLVSVGCSLWVYRFIPDSQVIFYGLARFIGTSAVDWLRHNTRMDFQTGAFQAVAGLVLYIVSGAIALLTQVFPRHAVVVSSDCFLPRTASLPYTPPSIAAVNGGSSSSQLSSTIPLMETAVPADDLTTSRGRVHSTTS